MATCKDCIHERVCFALIKSGLPYDDLLPAEAFCMTFKNKADVVEVVRCKDCKHFIPNEVLDHTEYPNEIEADGVCNNIDKYTDKDHFCWYGKLKEREGK